MGFFKSTLSLLLFFILFSSSYATSRTTHQQHIPKTSTFSQAEKLIRSFNLFPKEQVNLIHGNHSFDYVPGKIVEKKFSFFSDSNSNETENLGHHVGYYSIPRALGARMFYFFFESRNSSKDDPFVIWLTGGPGCGSELALFYENGPFHIADDLSLVWNDYGWDKVSNILFIDQPIGTGFSVASNVNDIPHNEIVVSDDLYVFLKSFFEQHPQFIKNDLYITGESYAGHYIPVLASLIHRENKGNPSIHINLKGIAIGNGMTNPRIQYLFYTQFAEDMKLITQRERKDIDDELYEGCTEATYNCETQDGDQNCLLAIDKCEAISNKILSIAGNINVYDIRKKCEVELCYDFSKLEKFLNDQQVKGILGVANEFVSCSRVVYDSMRTDLMRSVHLDIPALLEDGIKVLIYAGEFDFTCNWLGNYNWVSFMQWSGQSQFKESKGVPFLVDAKEAGLLYSYGPLSFLKVYGAGHMVPMDQPNVALQMLSSWMQGKLNGKSV